MRGFAPLLASLVLVGAAYAEDAGAALRSGDAQAAAHAVTEELTAALSRSGARLYAENVAELETALAGDFAYAADLETNLTVEWRESAEPQARGRACGGFLDTGQARVTATSTSQSRTPGMSRLACAVRTQTDERFGWTALSVVSAGQGALFIRFDVEADAPAEREAAARGLGQAMERIIAAIRPLASQRRHVDPPIDQTT
ncbi:MAG: hypothetical protein AB7O04_10460 [Hyphomonadaceae bacterium]